MQILSPSFQQNGKWISFLRSFKISTYFDFLFHLGYVWNSHFAKLCIFDDNYDHYSHTGLRYNVFGVYVWLTVIVFKMRCDKSYVWLILLHFIWDEMWLDLCLFENEMWLDLCLVNSIAFHLIWDVISLIFGWFYCISFEMRCVHLNQNTRAIHECTSQVRYDVWIWKIVCSKYILNFLVRTFIQFLVLLDGFSFFLVGYCQIGRSALAYSASFCGTMSY